MRRLTVALASLLFAVSAFAANPPFHFLQSSYRWTEGAASTADITVVRSDGGGVAASVQYAWGYGFRTNGGTLNFGPSETTKTFTVTIPNDNVFTYHLGNDGLFGSAALINQFSNDYEYTTFLVIDDDPVPVLTGPADVTLAEGNSGTTAVPLHFKLSGPFGPSFTPVYLTFDGSAKAEDYSLVSPFIDLGDGRTSIDLTLNIKGDTAPEQDEMLAITLHLGTPRTDGVDLGRATIRVTILNDDYLFTPASQAIEHGKNGTWSFSTSVAATGSERTTLVSSAPGVAEVPPFVDVPAGGTGAIIPIKGVAPGFATITATLPASRGGGTVTEEVTVYEPSTLTFDRPVIAISLGTQTNLVARLAPPPDRPIVIGLVNSRPSVAEMAPSLSIDRDGSGTLPIRGIGIGSAVISTTLPPELSGAAYSFRVDVSQPTGLFITSLSSKSGPAVGNQQVTLNGNDMKGRCTVTFGGVSALNTAIASSGAVTTFTPPHAPGVVDVSIRCGTEEFTFAGAYAYTAAAPKITRITPATGSVTGGTIVTASGENFPRGHCALWFGNVPAMTLTNLQPTEMTAVAPPQTAGAVAVTLRCGGDTSTLNGAFTYIADEPSAEIAAVTPSSAAPGERVLIGGARFRLGDSITFGGIAALDMTTTPTEHFLTVPDVPSGPVAVALRDASGRTISGPPFTVKPPAAPQITSAPAKVPVGSEFVVNGAGFRPALSFFLAGTSLRSVSIAPTFAVLRVPSSMQPQTTTLALTDNGSALASRAIEVTAGGIAVESVAPQCVSTDGGVQVTIRGRGFQPGAVVTFGAADATEVVLRDANTITARVPASSGVTDAVVTVINPSLESGQLTGGFQYRWPDSACVVTRHRPAHH
jgi:hypothetical protein